VEKQPERVPDEQPSVTTEQKIVVHACSGEIFKGYIELSGGVVPAVLCGHSEGVAKGTITLRSLGSKTTLDIPLQNVKSLFFVKSFRGDSGRKDIRFYSNGPEVGNLWVEIRFKDNEIIEGLVENSVQHLRGDGLVVKPTDTGSNNLLIYVNKEAIDSFRILGVRASRT
jgi:hypothetical protein